MKVITSLNEFLMSKPKVAPTTKPGVSPSTKPSPPSPIRRSRPSVKPQPKMGSSEFPLATEDDVMERFLQELRAKGGKIEFNLKKYKK
jgi:hypothetical protein